LAKWLHGFTTEIPDELISDVFIAKVCDRFHKLPSEVLKENPYDIERVMSVLAAIDEIAAQIRSKKK